MTKICKLTLFATAAFSSVALTTPRAYSAICDYRPSKLVGTATTAAATGIGGAVAATGVAANAAGVYTLVHATSGLTMVGGTWAGASAAGTAGIIAGTGGAIGSTVAVVTAPATIAVTAALAAVGGVFEGACFFTDDRITHYDEVNAIVKDIALTGSSDYYEYYPGPPGAKLDSIRVRDIENKEITFNSYQVKNLYIVDGILMHRDWLRNTTIGKVAVIIRPKAVSNATQPTLP